MCTVSCLYFMMEILFSLGTAHPAYMLNLFIGVLSHVTGSVCCIYIAIKSIKSVINLKINKRGFSKYAIFKNKFHYSNDITSKSTCINKLVFMAHPLNKRIKLKSLLVLIGCMICLMMIVFSAIYYLYEFLFALFPLSLSKINDMFFDNAIHIVGCISCFYVMNKIMKYIKNFLHN